MKKPKIPVPTFIRSDEFASWHDDNIEFGEYDEDEIDGELIGILTDEKGNVTGLWYNRAGFGTISEDYAKLFPDKSNDFEEYSIRDNNYPY